MAESTVRLTVAQAAVRFLAHQHTERDGVRQRFFAGCLGIFGHGNLAGVGQALLELELEDPALLPYVLGRNEQAMVHTAAAYARAADRLQAWAVTTSIGPGATNLVTGAALATTNRVPVLLLPGDVFATRPAPPVLQELERPDAGDVTVNDTLRPVCRFFDRVWRPEQLPSALLGAMRVLTDPAETGAVAVALPQDVQAEAHDWPAGLFAERTWHVGRVVPQPDAVARAAAVVRAARAPLVVAGGGVRYSQAQEALRLFAEATGIPVCETQAGKGALRYDHPLAVGAVGVTGSTAANTLAADADVVIGVGTRYSDFTTASRTVFAHPGVRFVNINVAGFDAAKHSAVAVVADAREGLRALGSALAGYDTGPAHRARAARLADEWDAAVTQAYTGTSSTTGEPGELVQAQVIGLVNELSDPRDVVLCAAGSMPGDLHKMWRTRDPAGYHVEYAYSCMGYEVAGGIGARLAHPDRDVFVLVGDGSYLMMATELATAAQEGVKVIVVLVDNGGFASIGALSQQLGSRRFGTRYRHRTGSGRLDGGPLPVDLAANAASLGADVVRARTAGELAAAIHRAKAADRTTVIHVRTGMDTGAPGNGAWWDVPVSEVSQLPDTRQARADYERRKGAQRSHLDPGAG